MHVCVHCGDIGHGEVSSLLPLKILLRDLAVQDFVHLGFWKRSHLLNMTSHHIAERGQHVESKNPGNSLISACSYLIWIKLPSWCGLWLSDLRIRIIRTVQFNKVVV